MNAIETKLVLFTDAIARDDDALLRALLAHTPLAPADDEHSYYTNHFYESRSTALEPRHQAVMAPSSMVASLRGGAAIAIAAAKVATGTRTAR